MWRIVSPASTALLAAGLVLSGALSVEVAQAQPVRGMYVSGGLGLSFRSPDAGGSTLPPIDPPSSARVPALAPAPIPAPLPTGHAALGYGFADTGVPLRLELEGAFMNGRTGP